MRPTRSGTVGVVLLLAVSSCASTGSVGPASGIWRDQIHRVPGRDGSALTMRICRPRTDARARVAIINHGTPMSVVDRQHMQPQSCTGEVAQWFLARGYMVVFPLRRGHGDTGPWAESPGDCASPDDVRAGLAGAADVALAVDYATALPYAQPDRAVVVGTGTGGWATVAYGSLPHPHVSALISIAGAVAQSCRPDLLAYSAAYFATTDRTPMLWIYAANDTAVPPATAKPVAQSYQAAGAALQFEPVGAFDGSGQGLLEARGGSLIWGPLIERYVATL